MTLSTFFGGTLAVVGILLTGIMRVETLSPPEDDARPSVTALARRVEHAPSNYERQRAAQQLGKLGRTAQSSLPALFRALGDPDGYVRGASAEALASIAPENPQVVTRVAALLSDADLSTRCSSARALGAIGPNAHAAIPALTAVLESDVYYGVREYAATSLGKISPGNELLVQPLLRALRGTTRTVEFDAFDGNKRYYHNVQSAAARSLSHMGDPGLTALIDAISVNDDAANPAAEALAEARGRLASHLSRLAGLLVLHDSQVIERASWLLSKIGDPAVSSIAELLTNSDPEVRAHARLTLKRIGSPLALATASGSLRPDA